MKRMIPIIFLLLSSPVYALSPEEKGERFLKNVIYYDVIYFSKNEKSMLTYSNALKPTIETTASDIYNDYKSNELAAEKKYQSSAVKISGSVNSVERNPFTNEPFVEIAAEKFGTVHANITPSLLEEASEYIKGRNISLMCNGVEKKGIITLKECYSSNIENAAKGISNFITDTFIKSTDENPAKTPPSVSGILFWAWIVGQKLPDDSGCFGDFDLKGCDISKYSDPEYAKSQEYQDLLKKYKARFNL